ncbi:hypothetical protein PTKIN_Ptkin08bG0197200 [Pterospermum kingtungense]
MEDTLMQMVTKPIQLADEVTKATDEASSFKQECAELKSKMEKLTGLLRQLARLNSDPYDRPMRRIIDETEQVLEKALSLVLKCQANGLMKRVFTIIPAAAFRKTFTQLENSIGDVSWLLHSDVYLGLPPIAGNEPILCLIWEQIGILYSGSFEARSDAAASLVSLASDNDRYGKLIIEEGGVGPLLRLVKEGETEGQENAARAIGLLGKDPESVLHMIDAGVCGVFAKILKQGPMIVRAVTAWAVSELAANYPMCQDFFDQENIIHLLVRRLAFETIQEHSKYAVASSNKSSTQTLSHMEDVVATTMAMKGGANKLPQEPSSSHVISSNGQRSVEKIHQYKQNSSISAASMKEKEVEDPATKSYMKAMAARALWQLAKGNSLICQRITESRALLCFAVLLENGTDDEKFNSAMALMEITAVAEQDTSLRKSAFKPNSHACRLIVDQMLKIIEKADSQLLIPCMKAIGNLARTFTAKETRVFAPLVKLLDETEAVVSKEAVIALTKFACTENYLHFQHSKEIISAGAVKHLVQLVYLGEQLQLSALVLLCYVALHVPDSEELDQYEVLKVLVWASKQTHMVQYITVDKLLPEAKSRLEMYQSRSSRRFY